MVDRQAAHPLGGTDHDQARLGARGELQVVAGVGGAGRIGFPAGAELHLAKDAHGFEEGVARFAVRLDRAHDEAGVDQRCHERQGGSAVEHDLLHGFLGKPAGKDPQMAKRALLLGREQVVAPANRVLETLQPLWLVGRAVAEEIEAAIDARQDGLWGQHAHLAGGQLDGQRQSIDPAADLGNLADGGRVEGKAGIDRARAGGKELDRRQHGKVVGQLWRRRFEGMDGVEPLAADPQHRAAGGDDHE